MFLAILFSPPKNKVDSSDTLCYDLLEVKNLKESEVIIIMRVNRTEITIEYGMKTSVCAF